MTDPGHDLIKMLELTAVGTDAFLGVGTGGETTMRIFGGHVIAQALRAAYLTLEGRLCHSLNAYFIRAGDPAVPVIYHVERTRDGGSFTTRRIVVSQQGKEILTMSASFQHQEAGIEHQHPMPACLGPQELASRSALRHAEVHRLPEAHHEEFLRPRPVEVREVQPRDSFTPDPCSDKNQLWFRMMAVAGQSAIVQQCLLAYASDLNLLASGLRPHAVTWFQPGVMVASLDHTIWFHRPTQFETWHLYAMDSPFAGGARAFNRGSIYAADGNLVASVAQEGLVRQPCR